MRLAADGKVWRVVWAVSSIRDSLLGWLGASPSDTVPTVEQARHAMLELLLFECMGMDEAAHLALLRRIRYARDLEALWYLRPELVQALAVQHGERVARSRVNGLCGFFEGLAGADRTQRSNSLFGR